MNHPVRVRIARRLLAASVLAAATVATFQAATNKPPLHAKKWLAITGKPIAVTAGGGEMGSVQNS